MKNIEYYINFILLYLYNKMQPVELGEFFFEIIVFPKLKQFGII